MMDEAQPLNGEWFSLPVHTIAQAQKEGHGGGYVAMTLTFKMATTGKWTNLTQKVAKVKLFECNHQQNIGQKQHHQNTQVKLPTCSLYNPWHYDLSAHTVCCGV